MTIDRQPQDEHTRESSRFGEFLRRNKIVVGVGAIVLTATALLAQCAYEGVQDSGENLSNFDISDTFEGMVDHIEQQKNTPAGAND